MSEVVRGDTMKKSDKGFVVHWCFICLVNVFSIPVILRFTDWFWLSSSYGWSAFGRGLACIVLVCLWVFVIYAAIAVIRKRKWVKGLYDGASD